MLHEGGRGNVFARHDRHAEATRRAVTAWGLEILCREPKYYSSSLTAVLMPEGQNADDFPRIALEKFDIRSEEHTSELQSLMSISYSVFCLTKKMPQTADSGPPPKN